eukprot:scaffold28361_cov84-Phaeocystis_antarctica.AAC.1
MELGAAAVPSWQTDRQTDRQRNPRPNPSTTPGARVSCSHSQRTSVVRASSCPISGDSASSLLS